MSRIDNDLEKYLADHTTPEDRVLAELTRISYLTTYNPRMISGPQQGKLLEVICRMLKPARVLEIGTFTGYSTICMARGSMPVGHIDTIEVNDELEDTIREYLAKAEIAAFVTLHIGNALEVIPTLKHGYDMIYIDGDKREYPEYYELSFPKLRVGGYMLADNVLWNGKVLESEAADMHTKAIDRFNKMVQSDPRVENVLLPMRDGLMLIRKILE
jgi:predicted O-methyltransferase YrrM